MKKFAHLVSVVTLLCVGSVNAALIEQRTDFNLSAGPVSGTGSLSVASSGDFTATVQPFDTSLGVLNSFTIDWSVVFGAGGVVGSDPQSGSTGGSAGGGYSVAGISYDGNGGGNGTGGNAGQIVEFNFTVSRSTTFLVEDAGSLYSPGILDAVLGTSSFALLWDAAWAPLYDNLINANGSANGRVILTYDFVPVPVPATIALLAAGLLAMRRKLVDDRSPLR